MSGLTGGVTLAPLLVDIKADVAGFRRDMSEVSSTGIEHANNLSKNLSGQADKIGTQLSSMGKSFTMGLTLPLVGAGLAALKVGNDFEAQMSRVKAISGATGREFEKLNQQAMDLGASTAFSAMEAAQGMENLASAGFSTNEIMAAMPGMMDLAASSGEDLASSADIAASTLRGFGLEAEQAAHVADVLAKNSADTNAAVADTGEAMKYIAPVAHSMGLSLEEVTASIGIMANAGIKGSQAGTTLRGALSKLADPSKEAAETIEAIGFKAFDAQGNLFPLRDIINNLKTSTQNLTMEQKQQAISTIFGTEAMSGMLTLVDAGPEQLDTLTNSLKNSDGAAKEMATTMQDNAKSSIEQMWGSIETAGIKIAKSFAPKVIKITEKVGELADKFSNLSESQQDNIIKWGLMLAAVGPVLSIVGKGFTTFSTLSKAIRGVSAASSVATGVSGVASAGGLAGMASGLGTVAIAAAPVVAGLALVGAGIYAVSENNKYMNTSIHTTAEELPFLQRGFNALNGHTIKTRDEMEEMGLIYTDWNESISPETVESLEGTAKAVRDLNFDVQKSNVTKSIITEESANDLILRTDKLCKDVIQTIENNKSESVKGLKALFETNGIQDYEEIVLSSLDNLSSKEEAKVKENQDGINKILNNAKNEKREIYDTEKVEIEVYLDNIANIKLNSVAKSNDELLSAQAAFNVRLNGLDEQAASDMLQEQAKTRDEKNKAIEVDYDTQIEKLKLNWDNMNYGERIAAEKAIKALEADRDEKIKINDDTYKGYMNTVETEYPNLVDRINYHTGEILSVEQQKAQATLANQLGMFAGMDQVTKTGYYNLYNETRKQWENVYVEVDEKTGKINGAWNQTVDEVLGNPLEAYAKDINTSAFNDVRDKYDELKGYLIRNPLGADFYIKYNQYSNGYGYDANGNAISHYNYNGQDYVPYDGYTARLHKGERVLTAKENENYNNSNNSNSSTINFNGNYNFNDKNDIDYFLNQAALKLKGAR